MKATTDAAMLACYDQVFPGGRPTSAAWTAELLAELVVVRDGTDEEARAAVPWCFDGDGGDEMRFAALRSLLRGEADARTEYER